MKATKLQFKGRTVKSKKQKKDTNTVPEIENNTDLIDESNLWFDCLKADQIYGPAIISQGSKCLCYDSIQLMHVQKIDNEPTNVAQVFVIKQLLSFTGIMNAEGFYLNANWEFQSAAIGTSEQFTIEQKDNKFAFKTFKDTYMGLEDHKLVHCKTINSICLFSVKCQSKIVNESKFKRKKSYTDCTLGLPTKRSKY
eukprot:NODE_378_length_9766_cov_0.333816.p4 type:complete len:196 gc:universal NODE_378_length_9766_cov_0.333816:9645-9058(-)